MAGNSQRRGRTTGAGKKTATAGTGGKNRRSLAGRGATPPAEARPGHPAQRRAAADQRQRADRARARARAEETPELLLGRNPVVEALRAKIPANALYVVTGDNLRTTDERIAEAMALAADRGLPLLEVGKAEFDRMSQGALHQGIGLQVPPYDYAHPDDLLDLARNSGRPAADRRAGRRHRPAQPRRRRPLGGRLRRARRRRPAAPRGRHDRLGLADQRRRRGPHPGGPRGQPGPRAGLLPGRRAADRRPGRRRRRRPRPSTTASPTRSRSSSAPRAPGCPGWCGSAATSSSASRSTATPSRSTSASPPASPSTPRRPPAADGRAAWWAGVRTVELTSGAQRSR